MEGQEYSEELRKQLVQVVRAEIGAFAAPDVIHWAPGLPKVLPSACTQSLAVQCPMAAAQTRKLVACAAAPLPLSAYLKGLLLPLVQLIGS